MPQEEHSSGEKRPPLPIASISAALFRVGDRSVRFCALARLTSASHDETHGAKRQHLCVDMHLHSISTCPSDSDWVMYVLAKMTFSETAERRDAAIVTATVSFGVAALVSAVWAACIHFSRPDKGALLGSSPCPAVSSQSNLQQQHAS